MRPLIHVPLASLFAIVILQATLGSTPTYAQAARPTPEPRIFVEGALLAETVGEGADTSITRYGGGGEVGFPLGLGSETAEPPRDRADWSIRIRVDQLDGSQVSALLAAAASSRIVGVEMFGGPTVAVGNYSAIGPSFGAAILFKVTKRLAVVTRATAFFAFTSAEVGLLTSVGVGIRCTLR